MRKKFELNIKGYYRDEVRSKFPCLPGIYFVYRGIINNITRTCILKRLLYIGETSNLNNHLNEHDRRADFLNSLNQEEILLYSFDITNFNDSDRRRIEESLRYEINPELNRNSLRGYEYAETTIEVKGDRHAFIPNVINAPSY